MIRIIGTIITFLLTTLSLFNTVEIPQDSRIDEEETVVNGVIDIAEVDIKVEDITPEKVVDNSTDEDKSSNTNSSWWEYPKDIKQTSRNGNDLLVLVNKEYKLPSSYAPSDLVEVGEEVIRRGSNYYLRSILINDLKDMVDAAKSNGIDLSIVSAYRSYNTQASTYQYWINYNNGCVSCADRISARPGHSQHQLGTTLDFSSNEINDSLGTKFGDTKASQWLKTNAYRYGFALSFPQGYESTTGFSYEPWHYRYIGKTNSQEMKSSRMILESYLQSKN